MIDLTICEKIFQSWTQNDKAFTFLAENAFKELLGGPFEQFAFKSYYICVEKKKKPAFYSVTRVKTPLTGVQGVRMVVVVEVVGAVG